MAYALRYQAKIHELEILWIVTILLGVVEQQSPF